MSYDWTSGFDPSQFSDLGTLDPTAGDPTGWTDNFGGLGDTSDTSSQASTDPYNTSATGAGGYSNPGISPNLGGLGSLANGLGSFGNIPWSGLLQMLGGLSGYTTSQAGINQIQGLISTADPWGSSGGRAMASDELQALMRQGLPDKPTAADVPNLPGYQAGLEAIERSQAAAGYLGSGNMMNAMMQYGGQEYQQAFDNWNTEVNTWLNRFNSFAGPAGATVQPNGNAAQLMSILGQAEASKNNSIVSGLSGVAQALRPTSAQPAAAPASSGGGGSSDGGFGSILGDIGSVIGIAGLF